MDSNISTTKFLGFGVNADLGLLRATWYKDVRVEDVDDEEDFDE